MMAEGSDEELWRWQLVKDALQKVRLVFVDFSCMFGTADER